MQTETKHEEIILKEIRRIPTEVIPQVIKILHSLQEGISVIKVKKKHIKKASGLCGIWKDERSAEEIIKDIYSHRTGFGERKVEL
ncbi:MAG: hypothetical protein V1872_06070 [bacterium]